MQSLEMVHQYLPIVVTIPKHSISQLNLELQQW